MPPRDPRDMPPRDLPPRDLPPRDPARRSRSPRSSRDMPPRGLLTSDIHPRGSKAGVRRVLTDVAKLDLVPTVADFAAIEFIFYGRSHLL